MMSGSLAGDITRLAGHECFAKPFAPEALFAAIERGVARSTGKIIPWPKQAATPQVGSDSDAALKLRKYQAWKLEHVFEAVLHPYLLLNPRLQIVDANRAYLSATMTRRGDVLGCDMFEVFPDNPADPTADGVRNLSASLTRVLESGESDLMSLQRYDIRRPDGTFEERWWQPLNMPAFDDDHRLALIIHHVEDVTSRVRGSPAAQPPM